MHVTFDHFRRAEAFATDGITQNVRVQSLSQLRSLWKFENAAVVNDPGADIAALQRNNPDPPTTPEKVVRRPLTRGATLVRVIGKTFAPFIAVPFSCASE